MKLNENLVLVLPDTENKELLKASKQMQLETGQYDFHTGTIIQIADNLKDASEDFPFKEGDWVHYKPVGGFIVHIGREKGTLLETKAQGHLVMYKDQILLKR